jgi:hypothetical protein
MVKGAHLSPGDRLRQEQPQVTTTAALLQIGGNIFPS